MGFLTRVFRPPSNVEKQLEETYLPMMAAMMGVSLSEAKSIFREMLRQAKEEGKTAGTLNLPLNFGDLCLEAETADEHTKAFLAKKRAEGVRDEDIRWWGNMHDLERRSMLIWDNIMKIAVVKQLVDGGLSMEAAARKMNKQFPSYSPDPDVPSKATGEDRPLPVEIKDRVNSYVMARSQADPERFKRECEESSSFNALVRGEIRKGNL